MRDSALASAVADVGWGRPRRSDAGRVRGEEASSTWILPFVLLCVIVSDRAFVVVESGGRGVFPLVAVVAPLAALIAVIRCGLERSLGFVGHPAFVLVVLPYQALVLVLPVLGVMFHGYPERTMLSMSDTTTALSFLILGAVAASNREQGWLHWLLPAIALEFAYSLGQVINWVRGPGWELFTPFAEWDRSLAALAGQLGSEGRATGLFTNPNELGLWASVTAVVAWAVLPGRQRTIAVTLAALTLLLSQARGATVGLVAAVVAGAAIDMARGRLLSVNALRAVATVAVAASLVAVTMALQLVDLPLDRFGFLIQVLVAGPEADANLAARINLWSGVLDLNRVFPWGTWGSPELVLGTAIDSAWFRAFAQGSAILVAAIALLFGVVSTLRSAAYGDALRLTVVVVAVVGLTQVTLASPVIPLFWTLLGVYLSESVARRRERQRETMWSSGTRVPAGAVRR